MMDGRGAPMIFAAVFTVRWRVLRVSSTAVPVPDSDAAGQHTLNGAPVECGEDGWWETCSFQPAEKVLGAVAPSWRVTWSWWSR